MKTYLGWVQQLAGHYPECSLPELSSREVLDFLIHLQSERKLQGSTVNQAVCSLRTLYRDHLNRRWKIWSKVKILRGEALPEVLTRGEVAQLLRTFRDGRYRAYFTLVYQCGLRMSEALSIRPHDINGQRLILRISEGKGGKPREVPITQELLARLRTFWKFHRNPEWLFPAPGRGWKSSGVTIQQALHDSQRPMTKSSVWAAFNLARAESGLIKTYPGLRTHTLRHSYATHLLEAGVTVRQVSAYLGHTTMKPTMVYLHLTEISESQARIALESLPMG